MKKSSNPCYDGITLERILTKFFKYGKSSNPCYDGITLEHSFLIII